MKILVTMPKNEFFDSFFPTNVQNKLAEIGSVEYNNSTEQFSKKQLHEKLLNKDIVITGWGTELIDEDVLEGNSSLKVIAHTGGSVHGIVGDAAYNKGIKVLSGNELYAESVAESVIAYALTALRKIPDYMNLVKNGGWSEIPVWEGLLGQKVGIVGYGMTAKHLVKMLKPFHCEIYVNSAHVSDEELEKNNLKRASLDEIFDNCKIVSLHLSMTPKNYHIINRRLLEKLTPESILINTARGGIIDEPVLVEMLRDGRFRAVLDVFEEEPLPVKHLLRDIPGAYVIPHRAGPTYDRRKNVTFGLIDDIENYFAGRELKLEITQQYASIMTFQPNEIKDKK